MGYMGLPCPLGTPLSQHRLVGHLQAHCSGVRTRSASISSPCPSWSSGVRVKAPALITWSSGDQPHPGAVQGPTQVICQHELKCDPKRPIMNNKSDSYHSGNAQHLGSSVPGTQDKAQIHFFLYPLMSLALVAVRAQPCTPWP